MPRGRPPSPTVVRARELATPTTTAPELVAQLQSEGLHLDPRAARAIAHAARPPVVGETADQRIVQTRAVLLRLAASVGYAELHGDQPALGWRVAVAGKLGVNKAFVTKAWKRGVFPATRAKWTEIISRREVARCEPPG